MNGGAAVPLALYQEGAKGAKGSLLILGADLLCVKEFLVI